MVRAHALGASISALPSISTFNSTIVSAISAEQTYQQAFVQTAATPGLQGPPRSILERHGYSSVLTLEQQRLDAVMQSFEESAVDGEALAFILGAKVLAGNIRLGIALGERVALGVSSLPLRARIAGGIASAIAFTGCGDDSSNSEGVPTYYNDTPHIFPIADSALIAYPGQKFSTVVTAGDEEYEALTLSLVKGPEGVKLEPKQNHLGSASAELTWDIPPCLTEYGKYEVEVSVTDARGASSIQKFLIDVKPLFPADAKELHLKQDTSFCYGLYEGVEIFMGKNVHLNGNGSTLRSIIHVFEDNCSIEDLKLEYTGGSIHVDGVSVFSMNNVNSGADGLWFFNSSDIKLENVHAHGEELMLNVEDCNRFTIRNSSFTGVPGNYDFVHLGIFGVTDLLIEGSQFSGLRYNGIYMGANGFTIRNNTIQYNQHSGINFFENSTGGIVEGNIIYGNGRYGIEGKVSDTIIRNNTITNNKEGAISVDGINLQIYDNN